MDTSTACDTPEVLDRPNTRNSSRISSHLPLMSHISTSTQIKILMMFYFRKSPLVNPPKKVGKDGVLVDPKILECIVECETTARCSLSTAITVTQIVANRIFNQNWQLPLALDKDHLRDIARLKRLKSKRNELSDLDHEGKEIDEERKIDAEANSVSIDNESEEEDIENLKERIAKRKIHNSDPLPSMTAVREARHLII